MWRKRCHQIKVVNAESVWGTLCLLLPMQGGLWVSQMTPCCVRSSLHTQSLKLYFPLDLCNTESCFKEKGYPDTNWPNMSECQRALTEKVLRAPGWPGCQVDHSVSLRSLYPGTCTDPTGCYVPFFLSLDKAWRATKSLIYLCRQDRPALQFCVSFFAAWKIQWGLSRGKFYDPQEVDMETMATHFLLLM